ncbi:MAG: glycosyltransferase family 9 protein [Candidatus Krumholzibacteriota bacterium]
MSTVPSQSRSGKPRDILVVRFGSLGDLCLLGWALARLADRSGDGEFRVTLVTKPAFAPLMENIRGIHRVIPLPGTGPGAVVRLAAELRKSSWDLVIDAHNILRGHLLLGLMGRRPDRRLAKDTAARLAFMRTGRLAASLKRTMHDRFEELTGDLAPGGNPPGETSPPLASLAAASGGAGGDILGLAPGAQWDTKRWPENNFLDLVQMHLMDHPGTVRIFLGPREDQWFSGGPLDQASRNETRIQIIRDRTLPEVATLLSECQRLVTNDSGLLHVAEAVGTPVLAFFGPTVREFGYYPVLPQSLEMEKALDCRPCSRNGKRPCHRGDLACLRDITPDEAYSVLNSREGN